MRGFERDAFIRASGSTKTPDKSYGTGIVTALVIPVRRMVQAKQ